MSNGRCSARGRHTECPFFVRSAITIASPMSPLPFVGCAIQMYVKLLQRGGGLPIAHLFRNFMEEGNRIERSSFRSAGFRDQRGHHFPRTLLMEHRAVVETAKDRVAIYRLLHFAFRCSSWYPTSDSN